MLITGRGLKTKAENIQLYPVDSSPYGIPFANWTGNWWKWALEAPEAKNPVSDVSGKNCAEGQGGPVWFLAVTEALRVRSWTTPADKAIFVESYESRVFLRRIPSLKDRI